MDFPDEDDFPMDLGALADLNAEFFDDCFNGDAEGALQKLNTGLLDPNWRRADWRNWTNLMTLCMYYKPAMRPVLAKMLEDSRLDVNARDIYNATALCLAAKADTEGAVELLLSHPKLDVNAIDDTKDSAILNAFRTNHIPAAKLLLSDPRLDLGLNGQRYGLITQLMYLEWQIEENDPVKPPPAYITVKYVMASYHRIPRDDIYGAMVMAKYHQSKTDAEKNSQMIFVRLCQWYLSMATPEYAAARLRQELGWDPASTIIFRDPKLEAQLGMPTAGSATLATTLFLSDDYLKIRPESSASPERARAARFWRIMIQLPVEVQMVLSNRAHGEAGSYIPAAQRETSIQTLALHRWPQREEEKGMWSAFGMGRFFGGGSGGQ